MQANSYLLQAQIISLFCNHRSFLDCKRSHVQTMIEVLTFLRYYLPGYTAGGPIRTIANLVDELGDEFLFKIITSHVDPRDPSPYKNVRRDEFQKVGKAMVYYASPGQLSLSGLKRLTNDTSHDVIYLNSFTDPNFTIKPLMLRRLNLIPASPLVIAPRGEFSPGALAIRRLKKQLYIKTANSLGLYKGVTWQASSEYESADIRKWFGRESRIHVAPNLPEKVFAQGLKDTIKEKKKGRLRTFFLSRIARKKNLDGALRILKGVQAKINFDIYGPLEDTGYWEECKQIIAKLPSNVSVQYQGTVPHEHVGSVMSKYDLFFFPTHGENYGHVILEALSAGCPVLISDQTPWRSLEKNNAGWDVPLSDVSRYRTILNKCGEQGAAEFARFVESAKSYAKSVVHDARVVEENRVLFRHAVGPRATVTHVDRHGSATRFKKNAHINE